MLPGCGDGVPDTGEECDDGNTADGDGCTSSCIFEPGACGNGVIDAGEECDDGNANSGDGCDATCHFEAGTCGNGVLEAGEECDDGNLVPGDGCDAACDLEATGCGDGVVDPGEQCDNGPANSDVHPNACRTNCRNARCGDNVIDTGEACDDGNTSAGDGCDAACQVETVPGCGNGVTDGGEGCDDGNTTSCDGCSAVCQIEACGNGVRECAEACDDGNTVAGDGCNASCGLEPITTCQPAASLTCGQSATANNSGAGSTNNLGSYSCSPWNESGPEYAYIFTAPSDSFVTVTLSGMSSDLDIFVIEDQAGSCEASNCIEYGGVSTTFVALTGSIYYLVVDGYYGAQGPFSIHVQCGECGDGNVDPDEECDDGNLTGGDGCSGTCHLEGCGNGNVDAGEQCDDGNSVACDGCSASCQTEACGNGVVECGEECDDGNTSNGDGCDSACALEGATCSDAWTLSCGAQDRWSTSNYGATDVVDSYGCSSWNETGPEYIYEFVAQQSGQVTVALSELDPGVDLDVFVMNSTGGVCSSANCIQYGSLSATFSAVSGQTYYVSVDGFYGDEGNYTINMTCPGGSCGDGVLNAGEACDDGNTTACDGCSATCQLEGCGNGVVECGEDCDDGNTVGGDGCSASCMSEATACVPDWFLGCGDTNSWTNNGTGSTDNIDSYTCTGWDESGPEYTYWFYAYQSGSVTVSLTGMTGGDLDILVLEDNGTDGCAQSACIAVDGSAATFNAVAGTYYYFVVDGYQGDTSPYNITVDCGSADPSCGNGSVEPGEQCDDNNTTSGDGCSSACSLEGGSCGTGWPLACGGTDSWTTEYGTNRIERYSCTGVTETGPEYAYRFTATQTGTVQVVMSGVDPGVDLDLFVLLNPYGGCTPGNCLVAGVTVGMDTVQFEALEGQTYHIVVDGYQAAEGSYDIALNCL
ncbi:MAG: DUF4215 domain-containing protein [bacterium]